MGLESRPRVVALAALRRGDEVLAIGGTDPATGERFHRMLGGGVEFGESGRDAVVRELREELDAELTDVRWLGAIENLFEYGGQTGHEIVLVYGGRFADPSFYDRDQLLLTEGNATVTARWVPLAELDGGGPPLYPAGVRALLDQPAPPNGQRANRVTDKAVAYVVHRGRLLTFTHDEDDPITQSGLQVPAGTIVPGEPPEQVVLREAQEATGLGGIYVNRFLGMHDYDMRPTRDEIVRRRVYLLGLREHPPDSWVHRPGGVTLRFRWVPIGAAHVLSGGLGALLGAVPRGYLDR